MIITEVCKANSLNDVQKIEDRIIIIDAQIPSSLPLAECEGFHERQAALIDETLFKSLPQGTYDRLGIMFMQRKVTLYQGMTGT